MQFSADIPLKHMLDTFRLLWELLLQTHKFKQNKLTVLSIHGSRWFYNACYIISLHPLFHQFLSLQNCFTWLHVWFYEKDHRSRTAVVLENSLFLGQVDVSQCIVQTKTSPYNIKLMLPSHAHSTFHLTPDEGRGSQLKSSPSSPLTSSNTHCSDYIWAAPQMLTFL